MTHTTLIRHIKDFQLKGIKQSSDGDNLNMVMRKRKIVSLSQDGTEILCKIVDELQKHYNIGSLISNKQLEKYFLDDFFSILIKESTSERYLIKKIDKFVSRIKELVHSRFTLAIPISGLVVKKDFNVLNYKIISKSKFINYYKTSFQHKDLEREYKHMLECGESIAIIEDFGDKNSIKEKHIAELDLALNSVRLFIPQFWHHVYQVQISITTKKIFQDNICYVFDKKELKGIQNSVSSRQHSLSIDEKRTHKHKYTIRTFMKKYNFEKLNKILLEDNKISILLKNSLKWIGLYTKEKDVNLKFLFLIFSLEGIFINEQNNYSTITASISEKVALLINKKEVDRIATFKLLKKYYEKRSSIVHGSTDILSESDLFNLYNITINVYYCLPDIIIKNKITSLEKINDYFLSLKFK